MNYFQDFETKAVKATIKFQKENRQKPLTQFQLFIFYETRLFTEKFSRTTTIHPGIFGGWAISIRVFSADGHYLVNKPLQAAGMSADNVRG